MQAGSDLSGGLGVGVLMGGEVNNCVGQKERNGEYKATEGDRDNT